MNDTKMAIVILVVTVTLFVFVLSQYRERGSFSRSQESTSIPSSMRSNLDFSPDGICRQDRGRLAANLRMLDNKRHSPLERLNLAVTNVVHTGCRSLMRVGGSYIGSIPDGHKYVCLDDIDFNNCLIYSFGLNKDWSFEYEMLARGCTVHGFDYSLDQKFKFLKRTKYTEVKPGFHVYLVAASNKTNVDLRDLRSNPRVYLNYTPAIDFADILTQNGHWEKNITYLKMDIEGFELHTIPAWLNSTSLRNVQQLAMEMHTWPHNAKQFISMVRDLYLDGYVPIMWDPNLVYGKGPTGIYSMFEFVLRRTDLCVL